MRTFERLLNSLSEKYLIIIKICEIRFMELLMILKIYKIQTVNGRNYNAKFEK